MTKKTQVAIQKSIEHWVRMRDDNYGIGEEPDVDNCPLCKLFYAGDCVKCPIFLKTGEKLCGGTPYGDAGDALTGYQQELEHTLGPGNWLIPARKKWKRTSNKMIRFLRSLLPKE